jgi:tRNA (cmo5U34)-methyltransferase
MTQPASHTTAGFFNKEMAAGYDQRNAGLAPISECLHFLLPMVLADLPAEARVLCVGVGTGAEMLSLAAARPGWRFVGVDPSAEMLEVGQRRLAEAGIAERCRLIQGYVDEVEDSRFDAVVGLLVAHFVQADGRAALYRAIHDRLRPSGHFVSAEISAAFDSPAYPAMLGDWRQVHARMGATPEALDQLPNMLRSVLGVMSPDATEAAWIEAGFSQPIPFFQAFMIRGWHAIRG